MMPMSSVVPSPMHAVICGVAIFSAYCGLEVATEITRNAIDPYMYPDKWYVTELRGMLIPVVFAIAGAVATMLMLVPISYYVQKKLRERRGRKDPERLEERSLSTTPPQVAYTSTTCHRITPICTHVWHGEDLDPLSFGLAGHIVVILVVVVSSSSLLLKVYTVKTYMIT
eukprot:2366405-Amphidinium_carterae.1